MTRETFALLMMATSCGHIAVASVLFGVGIWAWGFVAACVLCSAIGLYVAVGK